jgi:hypothetical protein
MNRDIFMINSEWNLWQICQHSCRNLKAYLKDCSSNEASGRSSSINNYDHLTDVNQADYIPSYNVLRTQLNYTIGAALIRMEIRVELRLKEWINRPSLLIDAKNSFEILQKFFEDYQNAALSHYYSKDPLGYNRFVLTSLTIICYMHEKLCIDPRFERL